ncbi:hypothetical protein FQA39_LY08722 [Lamprigera yunnana]|nr:hypothetical protein FQA39_LY08722 [Lamprigera yunnana]
MTIVGIPIAIIVFILWVNIRHIKKNTDNNLWDVILFLLLLPVLLICIVTTTLSLPFLWLYRKLIASVLKIKLGDEFFGLISGMDVPMACYNSQNSLMSALIIYKCRKTTSNDALMKYFRNVVETNWRGINNAYMKKFFTAIDEYMGCLYLKNSQINIEECICELASTEEELDRDKLIKLLGDYYYKPLPPNALWDFHIGLKPLKWKDDPDVNYYPMFVRVHHVITDGITLTNLLSKVFADEIQLDKPQVFPVEQHKELLMKKIVKIIYSFLNSLVYCLSSLFLCLILKGHDNNAWSKTSTSNKEILQFCTDEDGSYFRKVKEIKRKCDGTLFSEILMTALSASLDGYFKKNNLDNPKTITLLVPVVTNQAIRGLITNPVDIKDIKLINNFTVLLIKLPINIDKNKKFNKKSPLISRLHLIKESTNLHPVEYNISHILFSKMMSNFPSGIGKSFMSKMKNTSAMSVLPGPPPFSHCNGIFIASDIIFWIPHVINLAVNFSCYTFNDRLTCGLNCNSSIISEQTQVDEILGNIYKYIDVIEEEVNKKCN